MTSNCRWLFYFVRFDLFACSASPTLVQSEWIQCNSSKPKILKSTIYSKLFTCSNDVLAAVRRLHRIEGNDVKSSNLFYPAFTFAPKAIITDFAIGYFRYKIFIVHMIEVHSRFAEDLLIFRWTLRAHWLGKWKQKTFARRCHNLAQSDKFPNKQPFNKSP